jgi:hypothetical protein
VSTKGDPPAGQVKVSLRHVNPAGVLHVLTVNVPIADLYFIKPDVVPSTSTPSQRFLKMHQKALISRFAESNFHELASYVTGHRFSELPFKSSSKGKLRHKFDVVTPNEDLSHRRVRILGVDRTTFAKFGAQRPMDAGWAFQHGLSMFIKWHGRCAVRVVVKIKDQPEQTLVKHLRRRANGRLTFSREKWLEWRMQMSRLVNAYTSKSSGYFKISISPLV